MTRFTISRRRFMAMAGVAGLAAVSGMRTATGADNSTRRITILHTNDTHSRLDPFPLNDPNFPGMGGYARRAAIIQKIRSEKPELLLLDAGDIFQGTPYFNMFGGKPELMLMTKMGYDAATLGNHEFDNGIEGLADVLPNAGFPFISSNYDLSRTILHDKILPYLVLKRRGVNIGIYGLGINLEGLVSPAQFGDYKYLDPIEVARDMENQLHTKHNCQLIICLSHLGFAYNHPQVSDSIIASETKRTNIIIGGHTHTLLDPPVEIANRNNMPVTIVQTGFGGVRLGHIEVEVLASSEEIAVKTYTQKIH